MSGLSDKIRSQLADHVSVRASHTALLFSERAAALTVQFLREGRFS